MFKRGVQSESLISQYLKPKVWISSENLAFFAFSINDLSVLTTFLKCYWRPVEMANVSAIKSLPIDNFHLAIESRNKKYFLDHLLRSARRAGLQLSQTENNTINWLLLISSNKFFLEFRKYTSNIFRSSLKRHMAWYKAGNTISWDHKLLDYRKVRLWNWEKSDLNRVS